MTNEELIQRIDTHIDRAYKEDYTQITVEVELLEEVYARLVPGYVSNRHRENTESKEFVITRERRQQEQKRSN